MKNEELREYYPNGCIKHRISYYDNGNKRYEYYYDKEGFFHRDNNKPAYKYWYEQGILEQKIYYIHGKYHKIDNPADICFFENGKIWRNNYFFNDYWVAGKLNWKNKIKNI